MSDRRNQFPVYEVDFDYDTATQTRDTLTDTWVFTKGGATITTIVVTYTNSGKTVISTVAKS